MAIAQFDVRTSTRNQLVGITTKVQKMLADRKDADGFVIVHVPHTTAAVTINENADPDVQHDMLRKLSELVPKDESYYRHGEGNSDSHVKTSLVGNSVTVLVEGGQLVLGRWQGIYLCEFDGPRQRQVMAKFIAAK